MIIVQGFSWATVARVHQRSWKLLVSTSDGQIGSSVATKNSNQPARGKPDLKPHHNSTPVLVKSIGQCTVQLGVW